MINSKQDFSKLCLNIRDKIKLSGQNIKLSSVRESTAQALEYRTASALLADLPVEFSSSFSFLFHVILVSNHSISIEDNLCKFPFPERMVLSESETNLVWASLKDDLINKFENSSYIEVAFAFSGLNEEKINQSPPPEGLTPDGNFGWYCSEHNATSKKIDSITIDPEVIFPSRLVTPELANMVAENLRGVITRHWSKKCKWNIAQSVASLFKGKLYDDKDNQCDLSIIIDLSLREIADNLTDISSTSLNRFANSIGPYRPKGFDDPETFQQKLYGDLIQEILGSCLLHENSDDDFNTLLWDPLNAAKPFPDNLTGMKVWSRREFYDAFLYSKEFKSEIERQAKEWLADQEDWNKPLKDIAIMKFDEPKILSNPYFKRDISDYGQHHTQESGLNVWVNPFQRGDDEFGYHENEEDDEFEEKTINDFLDFDEKKLREELLSEEYSEEQIESITEEIKEEALDSAQDELDNYNGGLPFTQPFSMHRLTVDKINQNKETELLILGTYFSEMFSVTEIGHHYHLLDSMSSELQRVSWFVQSNEDYFSDYFEDNNVFYITEFVFSNKSNPAFSASTLYDALTVANIDIENMIVIIDSFALTNSYFIGAPYDGCHKLKEEYLTFINDLTEALEAVCLEVHYIELPRT